MAFSEGLKSAGLPSRTKAMVYSLISPASPANVFSQRYSRSRPIRGDRTKVGEARALLSSTLASSISAFNNNLVSLILRVEYISGISGRQGTYLDIHRARLR